MTESHIMPHITVDDVSLSYADRGEGLPLLLVHGFPIDHAMWQAQIEGLSTAARLIAPDLRGFGQSDVTPGSVSMQRMADDLAGLLDALAIDEPVVLCGLSMGGYIALNFWRKYARRLRGLVLCDTRAAADTPAAAEARRQMSARVLAEGASPLVEAMQPRMFSPTTLERHPHVVEHWRSMVLRTAPDGIAAASLGMAERPDASAWLAEIRCPTLVLVGADDVTSPPEEMQDMARQIGGAAYVEIPNAGHLSPMENPSAVNAALAGFLATL
jgi:pimeloyl-ACP methyl ester carboxylesterase